MNRTRQKLTLHTPHLDRLLSFLATAVTLRPVALGSKGFLIEPPSHPISASWDEEGARDTAEELLLLLRSIGRTEVAGVPLDMIHLSNKSGRQSPRKKGKRA